MRYVKNVQPWPCYAWTGKGAKMALVLIVDEHEDTVGVIRGTRPKGTMRLRCPAAKRASASPDH